MLGRHRYNLQVRQFVALLPATGPMKRFLAILLIALLPLQSGWASVAALSMLCGPAGGTASAGQMSHDKHHDHHTHHVADAAHAQPGDCQEPAPANDGHDGSCANCHASCCTLTSTAPVLPVPTRGADAPVDAAAAFLPFPAHQRPERPKWASLA